ncbi:Hypothetical protein FKW44_006441 [Caligus rogercresseyi]|uniref:Uncharacterized protein n=1 Tax=Caligus rogercresseyi TaxID=217165 RepID=A0A7T8QSW7_CALRO|nr:Hypothetical protein FKW44_006441 [Caligus rogercresseyi]
MLVRFIKLNVRGKDAPNAGKYCKASIFWPFKSQGFCEDKSDQQRSTLSQTSSGKEPNNGSSPAAAGH